MANQHNSSTLLTLPGKRRSKLCFIWQEPNAPPSRLYTDKQEGHSNARLRYALKYCCSCPLSPTSECEDPAKMTHSRMAFASRDLCCSVRKVSSDQLCLLTSADSGRRERTAGVASVSERARSFVWTRVCYFNRREGCGSTKSRTSRVWTSWVSRAPTMGRRPKATCQFSARVHTREDPYS